MGENKEEGDGKGEGGGERREGKKGSSGDEWMEEETGDEELDEDLVEGGRVVAEAAEVEGAEERVAQFYGR